MKKILQGIYTLLIAILLTSPVLFAEEPSANLGSTQTPTRTPNTVTTSTSTGNAFVQSADDINPLSAANNTITSPDGKYKVTFERISISVSCGYQCTRPAYEDSLVLKNSNGDELARIIAARNMTSVTDFSVTNKGVYYHGQDRMNPRISFLSFDDFTTAGVVYLAGDPTGKPSKLPAEVTIQSSGSISFVSGMPGVADIKGLDLYTRRVNLEINQVLQVWYPNGKVYKTITYQYTNGILSKRVLTEYTPQGKLDRQLTVTYYADGKTVSTSVDRNYTNGVLVGDVTKVYNAKGVIQKMITITYFSNGKPQVATEYRYTNGVLVSSTVKFYDIYGRQIPFFWRF